MSNLSINVQVGATPPSSSTVAGTSLTVQAWKASLFIRNPARNNGVPAGSADSTQTTDGSGNATFTGLSSVDYWILVIDARGVTNWFPCPAARVGGVDPFVCTIPWSTPVSVTSPADDRGGDTIGGRTNQGLWAPRTHIHQIPASGGSAHGELVFVATCSAGGVTFGSGGTLAFPNVLYDPLSGSDGTGYTVPSALNGLNLFVDCQILIGGTTPTGSPSASDNVLNMEHNASLVQSLWVTVPGGAVTWDDSRSLVGSITAVATSDTIRLIASSTPSVPGMSWGGGASHFYTQMQIFAC